MRTLQVITNNKANSNESIDFTLILKAANCAKIWHGNQERKTGDPFYSHPLQVALLTANYITDTKSIITAILHDVVEDCKKISCLDITREFGQDIAYGVKLLTRVDDDGNVVDIDECIKVLVDSGRKDLLLIKFADRLHNVRTLWVRSPAKQIKVALETICYFIPVGSEIEDSNIVSDLRDEAYIYLIRNGVCSASKLLPLAN